MRAHKISAGKSKRSDLACRQARVQVLSGPLMKTKDIHQTVAFAATPPEMYEALMDEKKHAEFTGSHAEVSRKVGGEFSVWDGSLSGKNLELVPDKKIVQSWRADDWPKGCYSTVTFEFTESKDGTKLNFTQIGIPDEFYKDIKEGWYTYYWEPLKKYFN